MMKYKVLSAAALSMALAVTPALARDGHGGGRGGESCALAQPEQDARQKERYQTAGKAGENGRDRPQQAAINERSRAPNLSLTQPPMI